MSLNPFNTPLALNIKPSYQRWLIIVIPHLFVLMVVVFLVDIFEPAIQLLLVLLILSSVFYYLRLHIHQSSAKSITRVYQDSVKNWLIETKDGKKEVQLAGSSFMSDFLILMNFTDAYKQKYNVFITPDILSTSEFRRLSVRIKMV